MSTMTQTTASSVTVYPKSVPSTRQLVREKVSLIESEYRDDAFFIVDLGEVFRKLEQWHRLMPRVQPFYAIKCNSDPEICRFLADAGTGFDCASQVEISQILDMGISPSRVVYANPCKPMTHLSYAKKRGVDLMTFDGMFELDKIKQTFPDARLILRIQSSKEHKAKHDFNTKFGCDPDFAPELLGRAKSLGLNVVGISFHVGSLPEEVDCFASTIREANGVYTLAEKMGFDMHILDIGGGFPGIDCENMTFQKVAETVNGALDKYFPESRGIDIIAEPGRYLVTSAFSIAVNIIAKRVGEVCQEPTKSTKSASCTSLLSKDSDFVEDTSDLDSSLDESDKDFDSKVNMYYINDGIYGAFNNVFTDHAVIHPELVKPPSSSETFPSVVWGPTCDGLDCVLHECQLPDLDTGDWLYFHDMGAYTVSLSCGFNGIERPRLFYVCSDTFWNQVYPLDVGQASHNRSRGLWSWSGSNSPVSRQASVKLGVHALAMSKSCSLGHPDLRTPQRIAENVY